MLLPVTIAGALSLTRVLVRWTLMVVPPMLLGLARQRGLLAQARGTYTPEDVRVVVRYGPSIGPTR